MAAPLAPWEGDEGNNGVEVCLFDESPDNFSSAVRAISELASGELEPDFPDDEVERLSSSITFLREWRDYCYETKGVSFTYGTGSTSSRDDTHEITLPRFSSASVPQVQVTHLEDGRGNNTDSSDFICFAGGNVGRWTGAQGYAAYCGADGTAVRFQLTSRFWEKEPRKNRVPYFLCGSVAEEGTFVKIAGMLQYSPLPNVPLVAKKGPNAQDAQKEKLRSITNSEYVDPEPREG